MSSFVFRFRASQKWIRRNLSSASCGLNETSLKNIYRSPCAEERATSDFCFFGMSDGTSLLPLGFAAIAEAAVNFPCGFIDAKEANVFSLVFLSLLPLGFAAIAEAAVDFPCGFIVAEEANVFSLVFWSLETVELPLDSIEIVTWENLMDFNGNINYEKRFINRETKRKVKGIYWLSSVRGLIRSDSGETDLKDLEKSNERGGRGKAREEEDTTVGGEERNDTTLESCWWWTGLKIF